MLAARAAALALLAGCAAVRVPHWPAGVAAGLRFLPVAALSDEFDGRDEGKWDFAGERDGTGCSRWTGPAPLYLSDGRELTRVRGGALAVHLRMAGEEWFRAREYACVRDEGSELFRRCNWDVNATGALCGFHREGGLVFDDWACKQAPYCLPQGQTSHHSMTSGQVVSKDTLRYGYVETRMRASRPDSNTVAAAWLGREYWDPEYSRTHPDSGEWQPESPVRQRHWQEIDVAELFMTQEGGLNGTRFIPNVHLFADYDGRHTGAAGRGPTIHDKHIAGAQHNEMHWDPGPVYTHHSSWHDDWNTFAIWWDEAEIRFIVNGKERSRYRNRYIHQGQHVKFSLLSNIEWLGVPPRRNEHFEVDYVRVWKVRKSYAVRTMPHLIPGSLPLNDDMGEAAPTSISWPREDLPTTLVTPSFLDRLR